MSAETRQVNSILKRDRPPLGTRSHRLRELRRLEDAASVWPDFEGPESRRRVPASGPGGCGQPMCLPARHLLRGVDRDHRLCFRLGKVRCGTGASTEPGTPVRSLWSTPARRLGVELAEPTGWFGFSPYLAGGRKVRALPQPSRNRPPRQTLAQPARQDAGRGIPDWDMPLHPASFPASIAG